MATDKEAALPIEDFNGINRNIDREDLSPSNLYSAQNLWEKKLGTLETRGHSVALTGTLPTNITKLGRNFRLYKNQDEKIRLVPIRCTPDTSALGSLPAGIAVSFVTDAAGRWNNDQVFGAGYGGGATTTVNCTHRYVILRLVGYGVDRFYEVEVTAITGYAAATNQKLRVVVSSAQNSNITGIEILAVVKTGQTEVVATVTDASTYNQHTMWCGFIELVSAATGTFDFNIAPAGYDSTLAAGTTIGAAERTFSVQAYKSGTGPGSPTGTFVGGKTYYVAVLPQYTIFDGNPDSRCIYRNTTVDVFGGDVVAITIPGDTTGYINLTAFNVNTVCYMVAIGETPQLLQPVGIYLNGYVDTNENILSPAKYSPAVIDVIYTADGIANLQFRASDFSRHDMLMGVNDDGTIYPIFAARLHSEAQANTTWEDWIGDYVDVTTFRHYSLNYIGQCNRLGDNHEYQFEQWENLGLFLSTWNPNLLPFQSLIAPLESRTKTNYFVTDGYVAAAVIEDYQVTPITLPCAHYLKSFDGSIVIGGGVPSADLQSSISGPYPLSVGVLDSSKTLYFSRAYNPFDFTIPGAASTTHQTIRQDEDGENINGLGIFTNTSVDAGTESQLVTTKKNAIWSLNQLPIIDTGVIDLTGVYNAILSKKAGSVGHNTLVNTPIGLIFAAHDNVYLARENGEPTPVGQSLYGLLREADMTYASACYHDKHYKLSFYHPDYSGTAGYNNVEVWLNINKMIELKGKEDWVGPMVGRSVYSCFVEDRAGDGLTENLARDRVCVDQENKRIFKADVEPAASDTAILDFATAVTSELESKDFDISQQDNNWNKLLKRTYWKLRTNMTLASPLSYTEKTYVDGVLAETKAATAYGITAVDFDDQPLKLNPVFPATRQRGRTIRKVFTTTKRIGIAGFQINYTVERRRI